MGYLDYPGLQRYHGKVQDEINELKDDLTYYTEEDISVNTTAEGWRLTGTGACTETSTYKMNKYLVTAGDLLHLTLSKDVTGSEAEGVYQWQSAASVPSNLPNTNLIGTPVAEAVDVHVTVPTGATYLIVSQFKTNTTNSVKKVTAEKTVKEQVTELKEVVDNLDPGLSEEAKAALIACFENVAWQDEEVGEQCIVDLKVALDYDDGGTEQIILENSPASNNNKRTYLVEDVRLSSGDYVEWSVSGVKTDSASGGYVPVRFGENIGSEGIYQYIVGHKYIVYTAPNIGVSNVTFMMNPQEPYVLNDYREEYSSAATSPASTDDLIIRVDKDGLLFNGERYHTSKTAYTNLIAWLLARTSFYIGVQNSTSSVMINYIKVYRTKR